MYKFENKLDYLDCDSLEAAAVLIARKMNTSKEQVIETYSTRCNIGGENLDKLQLQVFVLSSDEEQDDDDNEEEDKSVARKPVKRRKLNNDDSTESTEDDNSSRRLVNLLVRERQSSRRTRYKSTEQDTEYD